ncbi:MAG TPA: lysoplasmalogenase, partial [Ktedonobacterales bacterium]|nr:lysoplasmalogenase [Ktedonobacterales bacterium]
LASSATLVLAGWIWYLATRDTPGVAVFALLIAVGMTCGFLGDLLLADVLPLSQGFLAGMAAFALGHLAYIAAILSLTTRVQWAIEGIALLVGLVGWYLVVFRSGKDAMLRWAALPYTLLLTTTAGVATGLAIQEPAFLPLAIGAALFLISDLLVAGKQFGSLRIPHGDDAIWLSYGPAQMLIVYAVNSALLVATTR